jgi:4-amino-4-deoxy-L-arabinose transferase-like glycosyltransferase
MNKGPARFTDPDRLVILVIALALALHLLLGVIVGFSIDETYDVVMARQPALSYHDHPPAMMWLIAAAVKLAGSESHLIVRLPTLILSAAQTWLLYRLTAFTFDKWAGVFAALALCLSPLFGFYLGTIAVTDGPLLFSLTAAALFVARALFGKDGAHRLDWPFAGLFFGLALLSKFSAVLLLPGLALFLLTVPRQRRLFLTPGPYLAAAVALLVFTPVIVWNFEHSFGAFVFQGSRAALGGSAHVDRALAHTAILIAVMGPAVWFVQIVALVAALRAGPRDERRWFFATLSIVPIAFFLTLDLFGSAGDQGPHWLAPAYLFTFPLLGAAVARWRAEFPRTVWWTTASCIGGAAAIVLVLVSHTLTGWLQYVVPAITADYDPLVADEADWWNLRTTLQHDGLLDSRHFLIVGRYFFCFKAQLVLNNSVPVVCLDDNPIALSLWRDDAALRGRDAVIVTNWWHAPQPLAAIETKFERVADLPPLWITDHGRPVLRLDLKLGHNLQDPTFQRTEQGPLAYAGAAPLGMGQGAARQISKASEPYDFR